MCMELLVVCIVVILLWICVLSIVLTIVVFNPIIECNGTVLPQ